MIIYVSRFLLQKDWGCQLLAMQEIFFLNSLFGHLIIASLMYPLNVMRVRKNKEFKRTNCIHMDSSERKIINIQGEICPRMIQLAIKEWNSHFHVTVLKVFFANFLEENYLLIWTSTWLILWHWVGKKNWVFFVAISSSFAHILYINNVNAVKTRNCHCHRLLLAWKQSREIVSNLIKWMHVRVSGVL